MRANEEQKDNTIQGRYRDRMMDEQTHIKTDWRNIRNKLEFYIDEFTH